MRTNVVDARELALPRLVDAGDHKSCPKCSRTYIWGVPDDRIGDPTWRPVCAVCGREPRCRYVKLIAQSLLDML